MGEAALPNALDEGDVPVGFDDHVGVEHLNPAVAFFAVVAGLGAVAGGR